VDDWAESGDAGCRSQGDADTDCRGEQVPEDQMMEVWAVHEQVCVVETGTEHGQVYVVAAG
jgi:hypothetical protein